MVPNHLASRASFPSLPTELVTAIVSHLDTSSAASLARVARRFTSLCESAIWREIRLSLNPHYGERLLVQPFPRDARDDHERWAESEAKATEDRRREGLREKVKTIMVQADQRRLGMVEKVVVVPRPGAIIGILGLLDMISPTIRVLELDGPGEHCYAKTWRPADHETLDIRILDLGLISFPSLTHLVIRKEAIRFPGFVLTLTRASPNLISLDVDINHASIVPNPVYEDGAVPSYPKLESMTTKLRDLRLSYHEDTNDGFDGWFPNPVASILLRSPLLERVSVRFERFEPGDWDVILKALSTIPTLWDLHLTCDLQDLRGGLKGIECGDVCFPAVRRLGVSMHEDMDFLSFFPRFPYIETLILEYKCCVVPEPPQPPGDFPDSSPSPEMTPDFFDSLRLCPRLRTIYSLPTNATAISNDVLDLLDNIETTGSLMGFVRSLHHGDEVLIHARIRDWHYETTDEGYCTSDESVFQDYIGFDGHTVPLELLRTMRMVDGAAVGDWVGRGVEVGDKAWRVLTGWRDAQSEAGEVEKSEQDSTGKKRKRA